MTEQAAEKMAAELNAKAPEGVEYVVRSSEVPQLGVDPWYVARVTD